MTAILPVRAAVIQAAPVVFDTRSSIIRLAELARKAAAGGAQLLLFPEAFVGGYPNASFFGAPTGSRSAEEHGEFRRCLENAIDIPGPDIIAIARIAHRHRIHLVVGAIERDGGRLYRTALTFGPDGRLLTRHRKIVPAAAGPTRWARGYAWSTEVVRTPIGHIGSAICSGNCTPQPRAALYAGGIEFYCVQTVADSDAELPTMRMIALEGRCFVLAACQFATRDAASPELAEAGGAAPSTIRGGSCIIDPLGKILAGPVFDEEAILFADLDRNDIPRCKHELHVMDHCVPPDIFRPDVDTRAFPALSFIRGGEGEAEAALQGRHDPYA